MMSHQYLPSYCFRKFCAGSRANKNEYPRQIRNFRMEKRKYDAILDQLIDLKGTKINKKGISRVKKNDVVDEERYKLGKNTSIQTGMRKKDLTYDLLPYIFLMMHPNVREINT